MEFEWDEEKRQKILAERSLDFADAFQFFDGRPAIHQPTKKNGNIVRYTAAELDAMKAAGKTPTDWQAAAAKPVPDESNPDDAMEPIEWATTELPMPMRKEHTNLRIDSDVLTFFRKQGRGYQTRINAVLRSYVEQVTRHKPRQGRR